MRHRCDSENPLLSSGKDEGLESLFSYLTESPAPRQLLERRAALAQTVAEGRAAAAAAERLLAPVAARKLRQEVEQVTWARMLHDRDLDTLPGP